MPGRRDSTDALEGPVCHQEVPSERTPLVWVGDGEVEAAGVLQRVGRHVAGGQEPSGPATESPRSFGSKQRGWLTRLTWRPSKAARRRLIRSPVFLDAQALRAMALDMPSDAIEVPSEADGFIDGLTPDGEVMFYALFEGPSPWVSAPLMPVPPPFEALAAPLLVGDAEGRVRRWASELEVTGLDATGQELIVSACAVFDRLKR